MKLIRLITINLLILSYVFSIFYLFGNYRVTILILYFNYERKREEFLIYSS